MMDRIRQRTIGVISVIDHLGDLVTARLFVLQAVIDVNIPVSSCNSCCDHWRIYQ